MKRPQTKLQAHSMRETQVIRSKKSKRIIRSKFIFGSNFSCGTGFVFINILLKLQQQILICLFYSNRMFVSISDVTMLFYPLPDDWMLCKINVVRQGTCSYNTWFGKCSMHYTYSVST